MDLVLWLHVMITVRLNNQPPWRWYVLLSGLTVNRDLRFRRIAASNFILGGAPVLSLVISLDNSEHQIGGCSCVSNLEVSNAYSIAFTRFGQFLSIFRPPHAGKRCLFLFLFFQDRHRFSFQHTRECVLGPFYQGCWLGTLKEPWWICLFLNNSSQLQCTACPLLPNIFFDFKSAKMYKISKKPLSHYILMAFKLLVWIKRPKKLDPQTSQS